MKGYRPSEKEKREMMPNPSGFGDPQVYDPETKTRRWMVLFKPKNQRLNKRDDKLDILRKAIGGNLTGDRPDNYVDVTRQRPGNDPYDRTPGISKPRHKYDTTDHFNPIMPTKQAIIDVNMFRIPTLIANLTDEQYHRVRKDPNIRSVDPEFARTVDLQAVPYGITRLKSQQGWAAGLHTKGQSSFFGDIDTGCDTAHEDLPFQRYTDARGWGKSFVPNDTTLLNDGPEGFHGTHTMGTVVAQDNDLGVVGVAPDARPFVLKCAAINSGVLLGSALVSAWAFSMAYQINVTNNSYGGYSWNATEEFFFHDMANLFYILNVCSAGNDNKKTMNGLFGTRTAATNQHYPSGYGGCIEVSASDSNDVIASFSNCGTKTEFVAPGVRINSTIPGNRYALSDGTSMAAPHVSGIMCLGYANIVRNACSDTYGFANLAPDVIRLATRKTADKLNAFADRSPDNCIAFGWPQADLLATEVSTTHNVRLTSSTSVEVAGLTISDISTD